LQELAKTQLITDQQAVSSSLTAGSIIFNKLRKHGARSSCSNKDLRAASGNRLYSVKIKRFLTTPFDEFGKENRP
jgi:hypothetical protein